MIENKIDKEATKLARKRHEIRAPSWISIAGHVYLENAEDKKALRLIVSSYARFHCAICKSPCPIWDGDLDHIKGGRPLTRCWCFHQELPDGRVCTNLRWVHGMWSSKPCHRDKHNREVKWTPRLSKS